MACGVRLYSQSEGRSGWVTTLSYPQQSEHFKTTSQKVARKFWWKNVKMIVIICVIVLIIVILIILFATGIIPT